MIFLSKNLRRCVGFIRRYSHLAKPPCQTRFLPVFAPAAQKQYKKNTTRKGGVFLYWSGRRDWLDFSVKKSAPLRRLYTAILPSRQASLSNTLSRVFEPYCTQSTNAKKPPKMVAFCVCGRGDEIRTRDILVPNQALYQAELHPVDRFTLYSIFFSFANIFL